MTIKITGSGSYIPTETVTNNDFSSHVFLTEDVTSLPLSNDVVTEKFYGITGIEERKYAHTGFQTSDMATIAAKRAIENARYVFPNACETKIIVTMNVRSLINFFHHRCCNRAQDEIRELALEMLKLVIVTFVNEAPILTPYPAFVAVPFPLIKTLFPLKYT
jgi:hypothetical protein